MDMLSLLANLRLQDVVDVLFLTVLTYQLYLWFKGTKALKALVGLVLLGIVYTAAQSWGLFLTTWVFHIFWQVLVILLIVLFQAEIRQVLERVNFFSALGLRRISPPGSWVSDLVPAAFALARDRIGALVVIERRDLVDQFITGGQHLEADPTPEVLTMIFARHSPVHDGAVIIRNGRVTRVSSFLPLSPEEELPRAYGTRHRAGLGLSAKSDALVIVVSEERGEVSLCREGKLVGIESEQRLRDVLHREIAAPDMGETRWGERVLGVVRNNWRMKLGTLALVSLCWLLLAGQQNFVHTFNAPVKIVNLPEGLTVVEPGEPTAQVTVRGVRKDATTLNAKNVVLEVNLSRAGVGEARVALTPGKLVMPESQVEVQGISPQVMVLTLQKKPDD
jgi:uncharacterized protein (TIGR00159 family)